LNDFADWGWKAVPAEFKKEVGPLVAAIREQGDALQSPEMDAHLNAKPEPPTTPQQGDTEPTEPEPPKPSGGGGGKKYPKKEKASKTPKADMGVTARRETPAEVSEVARAGAGQAKDIVDDVVASLKLPPVASVEVDDSILGIGQYDPEARTIKLKSKVAEALASGDPKRVVAALETLYHEVGHHIAETVLKNADQATQDAVDQDFANWQLSQRDNPLGKILESRMTPARGAAVALASDEQITKAGVTLGYALSKDEWLADNAARFLINRAMQGVNSPKTRTVIGRIAGMFRAAYVKLRKGLEVAPSMEEFLTSLVDANEARAIEFTDENYEVVFNSLEPGAAASMAWNSATSYFQDWMNRPGQIGLYGRTISTQFNKALQNPAFNKFWRRVHKMWQDTNRAISRPKDLAPDILPSFDFAHWKDAVKALVGKSDFDDADFPIVHDVLMAGTLYGGGDPTKGRLFSETELKNGVLMPDGRTVKLTPKQIGLYKQARAAVDASVSEVAAAQAWALARKWIGNDELRDYVSENPLDAERALDDAFDLRIEMAEEEIGYVKGTGNTQNAKGTPLKTLEKQLTEMKADQFSVAQIFARSKLLQSKGYMPAHRYGQYRIVITAKDVEEGGDPIRHVEHFESHVAANRARRELLTKFKPEDGFKISDVQVMDPEQWKLYKGVNPDTVMLFAKEAGIPVDDVMQEWYKSAISNRSAMSRMAHRKGYAGYSRDLTRSLATFLTSNGRFVGTTYHLADLTEAVSQEKEGSLKQEERELLEAVTDQQAGNDFASKARSVMANWYVLGSVFGAVVNMTQVPMQTAPALVARGATIGEAFRLIGNAYKTIRSGKYDTELKAAIAKAEADGLIASSEVYHAYQEAAKTWITKLPAKIQRQAEAFMFVWGAPFAMAENLNRKATFIAAWRQAKAQGADANEAFAVAEDMIMGTQGVYATHGRPNWSRSAFGSMAFTFKQFTLTYLEQLVRQARSGPQGRKAAGLQLALLLAASGLGGAPGEEDIEDMVDTVAQAVFGKAFVSRVELQKALKDVLGKQLAEIALYGVSGIPGMPIDISGKMGLSNLIPGTAWLKPSEKHPEREMSEFFGPVGRTVTNIADASRIMLGEGDVLKALRIAAPKGVQDFLKGVEMAATGEARTAYGSKMVDASKLDAIFQALGAQPASKASYARLRYPLQELLELRNKKESELAGRIALAMHDNDYRSVANAWRQVREWNATNPRFKIDISQQQLSKRINNMTAVPGATMIKNAAPEVRQTVREMLNTE
jgi:hypothetical protein